MTTTTGTIVVLAAVTVAASPDWKTDPGWSGTAEWAVYEATRVIYGEPRRYEATIFTNRQLMDRATTTKAEGGGDAIEVFKHNVSEIVPTENYDYRFLTTCFLHADTLAPFKLVASTQEDCGATYKQFVVGADDQVASTSFCYFPGRSERRTSYATPDGFAFHDGLSLRLRDYPFDAENKPTLTLQLVADQTDTHETPDRPSRATVRYVQRETLDLPIGALDAHHLQVEHRNDGGTASSDYWFAVDPGMRHVMLKYRGPHGVRYQLKRLDWWAYWREPKPS